MRKIKNQLEHELLKSKVVKTNTLGKNVNTAKMIILMGLFYNQFKKTFKYNNQTFTKNHNVDSVDKKSLSNTVFDNETFSKEHTCLISIWNNTNKTDFPYDIELSKFIIGVNKNKDLVHSVRGDIVTYYLIYDLILHPYITNIKDKDLLRYIENYIVLCATVKLMQDYFNKEYDKEYSNKIWSNNRIKTIKTFVTKFINLIPDILYKIAGDNNLDEKHFDNKIKNINMEEIRQWKKEKQLN